MFKMIVKKVKSGEFSKDEGNAYMGMYKSMGDMMKIRSELRKTDFERFVFPDAVYYFEKTTFFK